jgi:hypothetical protein
MTYVITLPRAGTEGRACSDKALERDSAGSRSAAGEPRQHGRARPGSNETALVAGAAAAPDDGRER